VARPLGGWAGLGRASAARIVLRHFLKKNVTAPQHYLFLSLAASRRCASTLAANGQYPCHSRDAAAARRQRQHLSVLCFLHSARWRSSARTNAITAPI
jgi:hypothetical protein